ncbi:MAG: sporulation protein YqfD [Bacillota bacterium]|nr:sporulation protein YqfD [Bacillota bacterium]
MAVRILNWFLGYLIIFVRGNFPERFVNLCTEKGIYLWNLKRVESGMYLRVSPKGLKMMKRPARISHCHIKICEKKGLPFKFKKHKKRKVLFIGFIICAGIIFYLGSFIWVIRVDGNAKITADEIKIISETCGLKQGVLKYAVDPNKFQNNAIKAEPRLAWIWVDVKGTVAYVHVREKTTAEKPVNVKVPCDLVASRSGVIKSIIVRRGNLLVKEGDTVVEGQVLISADKGELTPVHADGDILATYWMEKKKTYSLNREITEYTGKERTYYGIKKGNLDFYIKMNKKEPYEKYTIEETENNLRLWGDLYLPIVVKKQWYKETVNSIERLSVQQANVLCEAEMTDSFVKEIGNTAFIKNKTANVKEIDSDTIEMSIIFECEKNIGLKRYR